LLKNTEVTKYPEKRLQEEIDYNIKYYKNYAKSMGISYKEIIKQMGYSDEKAYKEDLEKYSKSTIKYYMMCEAIAKEEGLEISDADFKEKATALAKEYDYDTLTAMERNYSDDRIKEVLTAREVTKFVIKNTNFNYTEATTEQTINTNASDSTVTSETSDASTTEESSTGADSTEVNSTEVNSTEVGTSTEK
jgi:Bacterial trigger factor protein (TF) C-terminus.